MELLHKNIVEKIKNNQAIKQYVILKFKKLININSKGEKQMLKNKELKETKEKAYIF